MKIEQIKQYLNEYNSLNGTNFKIYHESKLYTFYYDGYYNGGCVFKSIKELEAHINGYIKALETFRNI